jgi:membrane-associated protein
MNIFEQILEFIRNPGAAAEAGMWVLALIVFLETGALVFFLPGDSLLVTAGFYAASGNPNILVLNVILVAAALAGPVTSYWIGAKVGPRLFNKPKSRWFNPDHLKAAHAFYDKHGGKAIVIARFMPIVRTFVPVVAGMGRMDYKRYTLFNVIGAVAWVVSLTLLGYFLGSAFPGLMKRIELVIIGIVLLSLLPGFIAWWKARRARREQQGVGNG